MVPSCAAIFVSVLAVSAFGKSNHAAAQVYTGNDFLFAVPQIQWGINAEANVVIANPNNGRTYAKLQSACLPDNGPMVVEIDEWSTITVSIPTGCLEFVNGSALYMGYKRTNKGIRISSSNGITVLLNIMSPDSFYSTNTPIYPTTTLQTTYAAIETYDWTNDFVHTLTIVANEPETIVTIVSIGAVANMSSMETFTIASKGEDALRYGITASKPIAVLTSIKDMTAYAVSMYPPKSFYGIEFYIPELPYRGYQYLMFLATEDDTVVIFKGAVVTTLDAGESYNIDTGDTGMLTTNRPVLVWFMTTNYFSDCVNINTLQFIPPLSVTTSTILSFTPYLNSDENVPYMVILTETSSKDNVLLDYETINGTWNSLDYSTPQMSYITVPLSQKTHLLNNTVGQPVYATVYGGSSCAPFVYSTGSDPYSSSKASACYESPCSNEGTCYIADTAVGYKCQCKYGFSGTMCERADPCYINQCQNGGSCVRTSNSSYGCMCSEEFRGLNCETASLPSMIDNEFLFAIPSWNSEIDLIIGNPHRTQSLVSVYASNFVRDYDNNQSLNAWSTIQMRCQVWQPGFGRNLYGDAYVSYIYLGAVKYVASNSLFLMSLNNEGIFPTIALYPTSFASGTEFFAITAETSMVPNAYLNMIMIVTEFENTNIRIYNGNILLSKAKLNANEKLEFWSSDDITGYRIVSDRPVVVFSGCECALFGLEGNCNPVIVMLLPTTQWGDAFVVNALSNQPQGEYLRIVAAQTNTNVYFNDILVANLQSGEFTRYFVPAGVSGYLTANNPIEVVAVTQASSSDVNTQVGAIGFIQILPVNFGGNFSFFNLADAPSSNLTINTNANTTSSILVNDEVIESQWNNVSTNIQETTLQLNTVDMYLISTNSSAARFLAYVTYSTIKTGIVFMAPFGFLDEIDVNPCFVNPCLNGGSCNVVNSTAYLCSCRYNSAGENCQYENYCYYDDVYCNNNGTCQNIPENRTAVCVCPADWSGEHCELGDYCTSMPCLNGATCINSGGSYRCQCASSFAGQTCDHTITCDDYPCGYHAECVPTNNGTDFRCDCQPGYYGNACQNYSRCLTQPCLNGGTCTPTDDYENDFNCTCAQGYLGYDCSIKDPCQPSPCLNNGFCITIDEIYDFICQCTSNFVGRTCQQERENTCASNPCGPDAVCIDTENSYFCQCESQGQCKRNTTGDSCASAPCQNGGRCVSDGSSYLCSCSSNYVGANCETALPCSTNPCYNNGTCLLASLTEYFCLCPTRFTGRNCENMQGFDFTTCEPKDYCLSQPCFNDGTCANSLTGYTCQCSAAYTGNQCETAVITTTAKDTATSSATTTAATTMILGSTTASSTGSTTTIVTITSAIPSTTTTSTVPTTPATTTTATTTPATLPTTITKAVTTTITTEKAATSSLPTTTAAHSQTFKIPTPSAGPESTCADLHCENKANGNYNDPHNMCTQYFFMCSNGYCYKFDCATDITGNRLYYDNRSQNCLARRDVITCN